MNYLGRYRAEYPSMICSSVLRFSRNNEWSFVDKVRTMDAGKFADRLTLMVRFSYKGSKSEIPLKFIIRLPGARQYRRNSAAA